MTLFIMFNEEQPSGERSTEIKDVRWATVYPEPLGNQGPEIVIHFMDYKTGQRNIPLNIIYSVNISND